MTDKPVFSRDDMFRLSVEATHLFEWSGEDDKHPEAVAFFMPHRSHRVLVGGMRRRFGKDSQSAIHDALNYAWDRYGGTAVNRICESKEPPDVLVMTRSRLHEAGPCRPTPKLLSDLSKLFGLKAGCARTMTVHVIAHEAQGSLTLQLPEAKPAV